MSTPGSIKVIRYTDDTVGIQAEEGCSLFTPKVAVEIAASLINAAKECDPTMDVEEVMKAYRELNGINDERVTRTLQ